ncbi:MAG: hypothetical protein HY327_05905 [Chloroflexi bacterium]|nr:hypothetical protein [Chloroflexota bacterium]
MSKPIPPGESPPLPDPAQQLAQFAALYRDAVAPAALTRFAARTHELGLQFSPDELLILAALETPARVQAFLDTQIYYNYDHSYDGQEETAQPPRQILQTAHAHCFEGALFAYAVNYLHGHNPQWVVIEASQDPEHNLVVYQQDGLYGANAHSGYPNILGRAPQFQTIRDLVASYYPYYYSDLTLDPTDITMVGYCEPFDLISKYGVAWMDSLEPQWEIYNTYIDDSVRFHFFPDDAGEPHEYMLVHALKRGWIQMNGAGRARVSVEHLPPPAQALWHAFWREFWREQVRPRGRAREIEKEFWALTHTTPIDLEDNASEWENYLRAGYGVERLLTRLH